MGRPGALKETACAYWEPRNFTPCGLGLTLNPWVLESGATESSQKHKMGKTDKNQAKLAKGPDVTSGEEQDLRQILVAMQHSLTQIDGKIDSLSYRMDRMTERLDKHAECLDQTDRRVSEVENGQTELATSQVKLNKELSSLRLKVNDLEAHSRRNNLRIVGIAIDNMEGFIVQILVQLLGRATFSDLFVVERAH
ncbi:hypothetical protein NDU88_001778 [Pleurodeles waltl]|uniref:Uncharacterized protein n=1 Tax=Pleurodeles waltl TaxID=8319 RepID=A0AAV7NC38_PLEWA|nr:hypothetical protein NDU88_001778 [Pleurodeles waltl]